MQSKSYNSFSAYKNVHLHFMCKYLRTRLKFPTITICRVWGPLWIKFIRFSDQHQQLLYKAMQYTEQTVQLPQRPIFTGIKLNWVRWPDSDSVRRQRKSRAMKTTPKKAESAPVLLILEQLWAGRMWKGHSPHESEDMLSTWLQNSVWV